MIPALLVAAVFLIGLGGWGVHLSGKHTPWFSKAVAIFAVMLGAGCLWLAAALKTPPVNDFEVKVVGEYAEGFVAEFRASNARDCRIQEINAFLVDETNKKIPVKAQFVVANKTSDFDAGYIVVANPHKLAADKVTFSVKHFCPFGFQINTELDTIKIPNSIKTLPTY